jgi:hypothetical protein
MVKRELDDGGRNWSWNLEANTLVASERLMHLLRYHVIWTWQVGLQSMSNEAALRKGVYFETLSISAC